MRLSVISLLLAVLLCGVMPGRVALAAGSTATTPAEEELGKKTAEQIEKEFKLVNDEKQLARLNAIAAEIAPFTQRPDVKYTCKILDTEALNAMAIPGGTIYFTKGLMNAVESDHELAGVMAHEIAHNSLYHAKKLMERESKASLGQILAVIATVYTAKGTDVSTGQLLTMSELVKQALLNGYSVELESEADMNAVEYLHKQKKYDPIGLYSVILGFRQMESRRPPMNLGFMKTHPYSDERKADLEAKLKTLGYKYPFNLWNVVSFHAELVTPKEEQQGYTIALGTVNLLTLKAADGEQNAKTRATEAVDAINRRLRKDFIQQFDVDVDLHEGKAHIRLRRIPVLALTKADAEASGMTLEALGAMVVQNIKSAIWYEDIKRS